MIGLQLQHGYTLTRWFANHQVKYRYSEFKSPSFSFSSALSTGAVPSAAIRSRLRFSARTVRKYPHPDAIASMMNATLMLYPGMNRGESLVRKEYAATMPPTGRPSVSPRSVQQEKAAYCFQMRSARPCQPLSYDGYPLYTMGQSLRTETTTDGTLTIRLEPAQRDGHRRVNTHRHDVQRAVLQVRVVVHDEQNDVSREPDGTAAHKEEEPAAVVVGYEGNDHGEDECAREWRDGEQLCRDDAVSEGLHDRWREIAYRRRQKIEYHEKGVERAAAYCCCTLGR